MLLSLLSSLKDLHWKQALSNAIDNVLSHYRKVNIPTFTGQNNLERDIKTYYDKNNKLNKNNKENTNAQNAVIISFQSDFEKKMKLYAKSVLKDMAASKKEKHAAKLMQLTMTLNL